MSVAGLVPVVVGAPINMDAKGRRPTTERTGFITFNNASLLSRGTQLATRDETPA